MTRLRIKFEVVIEYDANPEYYPGCSTPEEMLALDLKNAEDDPFAMITQNAEWMTTGEVVQ